MSTELPAPKIGQVRAEYLYPDRFQITLDGEAYLHLMETLNMALRAAQEDRDPQRIADVTAWMRALEPAAYEAMEQEEEDEP